MGLKDLLEKAETVYRNEMGPYSDEDVKRAKEIALRAIPEDVREYLEIRKGFNGTFRYILLVPECFPVELTFRHRNGEFEFNEAYVLDNAGRRTANKRNDIYAAIGRAHMNYKALGGL